MKISKIWERPADVNDYVLVQVQKFSISSLYACLHPAKMARSLRLEGSQWFSRFCAWQRLVSWGRCLTGCKFSLDLHDLTTRSFSMSFERTRRFVFPRSCHLDRFGRTAKLWWHIHIPYNHWLCHGFTFCATWPEHTYVASKQVQNWKRWKSENVTQNPSDVSHFIPFPIYITDNKSWKLISHPWPLEDSSWSSASMFAGTARKGIPRPIKIMLFVVFCCHPLGPKKVQGSICVCTSHF